MLLPADLVVSVVQAIILAVTRGKLEASHTIELRGQAREVVASKCSLCRDWPGSGMRGGMCGW